MRQFLAGHTGSTILAIQHLAATEWYTESQAELLAHPEPPHCLFNDIAGFFRREVKEVLDRVVTAGGKLTYEVLKPVIMSGKAVHPFAYCIRHQKICQHRVGRLHVAGTPCVSFSSTRPGGEAEDGNTMIRFAAWVSLRRLLQEALIGHENVVGFPLWVLTDLLGDIYDVDEVSLDPDRFGWPSRRPRVYRLLKHRHKVRRVLEPLSVWSRFFQRVCHISW